MPERGAPSQPVDESRRRRRRRIVLVAALVAALALRVALPPIIRSQVEKQANLALVGKVDVGDVDLWLLRGAAALDDVALHAEGAGPESPPLVAFRRLYVNVGWWPLLRRTVRVEDFSLDGLVLNIDRLKDGTVVLPKPRPSEAPPAPEEPAPPGPPWNVVVARAGLRGGHLHLQDFVVDPPVRRDVSLDGFKVLGLSIQHGPDAAPGSGIVQIKFGDGRIGIGTRVATEPDGFAVRAKINAENLPLDRLQVHLPELGWSDFAGRLDARVVVTLVPKAGPRASGTVAVRDLRIEVPETPEPVLAWRRFEVDVQSLDVVARNAAVRRVALDGGVVLVHPREPQPLRLLAARRPSPAAPPDQPPDEPPPEPSAEPAAPWHWKVGTVELADTKAKVFLEPSPLELVVAKATVSGLSSEPGSSAEADLDLRQGEGQGEGKVGIRGDVRLDPPGARLDVHVDGLALGPLVAATGAAPVVLPSGVASGDLAVKAEAEPLVVSGAVEIADLAVAPPEGKDFALGWKRLEIGLREVRVPGVLPPVAPAAQHGPLHVDLERLRLAAPTVELTRTPEGLVIPGATPAASDAAAAPATPAPAASEAAPPPPATEAAPSPPPVVELSLAQLELTDGQVQVVDRSVKPFYRGRVTAITLRARGLRSPENTFDEFTFSARVPGDAPVSLKGVRRGRGIDLEARGDRIPLAQANPYVTSSGYSIAKGRASFGTKLGWGAERYKSETRFQLDDFALAGAQGDALFAQNFGIPLSLGLALLRDVHGVIALTVPVSGDRSKGMAVDVKSVALQALARALLNAVASPLKLLGAAVNMDGGKVSGLTPEPIGFAPGRPEVADDAWWRVDQLANVLASYPALRFALQGGAGPDDVRALQEGKVLADLQADKGMMQSIRNLANRRERNTVRDYLIARGAGKPAELDAGYKPKLDEWAAAQQVSDEELKTLATKRAERLRALLAENYGVAGERLQAGEPQVDRSGGQAAVTVGLGG